jgi:hypothetical protein
MQWHVKPFRQSCMFKKCRNMLQRFKRLLNAMLNLDAISLLAVVNTIKLYKVKNPYYCLNELIFIIIDS